MFLRYFGNRYTRWKPQRKMNKMGLTVNVSLDCPRAVPVQGSQVWTFGLKELRHQGCQAGRNLQRRVWRRELSNKEADCRIPTRKWLGSGNNHWKTWQEVSLEFTQGWDPTGQKWKDLILALVHWPKSQGHICLESSPESQELQAILHLRKYKGSFNRLTLF